MHVGEPVAFAVVALGMEPLSYQWNKDGAGIGGATSSSYSIVAAQQADEGAYTCVVSNDLDTVTSDAATLTVCDPAVSPVGVEATDGAFPDRVRVSWEPVVGAGGYRVYRGVTDDPTSALLLTTLDETISTYDDTTAEPPRVVPAPDVSGCFGGTETLYQRYYYWVTAVNDCEQESDFGVPDLGWVGTAEGTQKGAQASVLSVNSGAQNALGDAALMALLSLALLAVGKKAGATR